MANALWLVYIDPTLYYIRCSNIDFDYRFHCLLDLWSLPTSSDSHIRFPNTGKPLTPDSRIYSRYYWLTDFQNPISVLTNIDWNPNPYTQNYSSLLILNSTLTLLGHAQSRLSSELVDVDYRNTRPAAVGWRSARAEATVQYPPEPDSRPSSAVTHS